METIDTRIKVIEKQAEAPSLGGRGPSARKRIVQREAAACLTQQPLAQWSSVLKDMCGSDEVMAESIYSTFTFGPLQNLHLKALRFLKPCLVQDLFSDKIYSHPGGLAKERKRLSLVRLLLLKACDAK